MTVQFARNTSKAQVSITIADPSLADAGNSPVQPAKTFPVPVSLRGGSWARTKAGGRALEIVMTI